MNSNIVTGADLLCRPFDELERLASRLRKGSMPFPTGSVALRVAVLASFTTDYLLDMLGLMLAHRGFSAELVACGYGQMAAELVGGGPALRSQPEIVFVLPTYRDLRFAPGLRATPLEANQAASDEAKFWRSLVDRIGVPTVMLSFDAPPLRATGEADGMLPGGLGRHARAVNMALADTLEPTVTLVDAEALATRLGAAAADPRLYGMCKQPFAMAALPELADTLAAAASARLGRARKVLVLDLDNTLWGGVVGDAGLEGITLGSETAEGEAFSDFQRYVQSLVRRGIVLAVCSKNDLGVAKEAFSHSAMVLKLADIACFVANFDDKATNLRSIAQSLNVGLDALVFVDDNPVERSWVRQQLPEVWTIELPDEPAEYAQAVEAVKPFPLYRLTNEDLNRTSSYQAMAQARAIACDLPDMETFLRDLEPVAVIEAIDSASIDRVIQLIAKTNQFKLNSSTFSLDDIHDRRTGIVALRLSDRLQDYGIVSVVVTEQRAERLEILNWVMSCRVFNRRLEHVMRQVLAEKARAAGLAEISASFERSSKNGLVPAALVDIGFVDRGDGRFVAKVSEAPTKAHHMQIRSSVVAAPAHRSEPEPA